MPTFNDYEDKTESAYHKPPADASAEQTLINIKVPPGQTFVLTHFANETDDAGAWGAVQWDIIADGAPCRGYTAIKDQYGTFDRMRSVPFGFVRAARDLMIITRHTGLNADGTPNANTYKLGVSIKGAYLPND